jgi:hypothetical protein
VIYRLFYISSIILEIRVGRTASRLREGIETLLGSGMEGDGKEGCGVELEDRTAREEGEWVRELAAGK